MEIHGSAVDAASRCDHYHGVNDVVGLKCQRCQQYFACYQCHDALRTHAFVACDPDDWPVCCGVCGHQMTMATYQQGNCPVCHHPFNPRCSRHAAIYFKK